LKLRETGDRNEDIERLESAISLVRQYPGRDRLLLEIEEREQKVKLEMPGLGVGYCLELQERMASLLGEEGMVVEKTR
ncbi:MAG: hypothetical protein ACE5JL_17790, partial [Dehalococcoidia bacterium]